MTIVSARKVEDCFDGSRVVRYTFDETFTPQRIRALEALGELDHFPDFPRPLFRVRLPGGAEIKGIGGTAECQVVFPSARRETMQSSFEHHFGWARREA